MAAVKASADTQVYADIEKTLGVCGGKACIESTRIRVLDIWGLLQRGIKPEEMLNFYSVPLTLAQVHAAVAYAYDNPGEIEAALEADRRAVAEIDAANRSSRVGSSL